MPLSPTNRVLACALTTVATVTLTACGHGLLTPPSAQPPSQSAQTNGDGAPLSLQWDPSRYQTREVSVNGQSIAVRAYEHVVYVAKPVDTTYQVMNIYVPEAYFHGQRVGAYTVETAPIFLPNQVGGYMPAQPGSLDGQRGPGPGQAPAGARPEGPMAGAPGGAAPMGPPPGDGSPGAIAVALSKGLVVASPGARGRTTQDARGRYTGKAPAAIVDLKAAVRYLRFNDARMPGDANKIISNGTSAGGALSALLGASGNSPDHLPDLEALGAADARDDIFAVSAYCPITNLDHADAAYEWLFNGIHSYKKIDISMLDFKVERKEVAGTLNAAQVQVSDELKAAFSAYLNRLGLRGPDGQALALDAQGQGSFKAWMKALLIASAQQALAEGKNLSARSWVRVADGRVQDIDVDAYLRAAGRMKLPPAFDALDLSAGENQLFGDAQVDKRHFTAYSLAHSAVPGAAMADDRLVRMMNPMSYIGVPGVQASAHWRIRQGTMDRDTALAVPMILAARLANTGHDVDLALPWDRPHSGDYDLDALFAWIAQVVASR
jgi:hypothetical protein